VTVDVRLDASRIAAMAHDTHACILTQASAAILAAAAPGMDGTALTALEAGVVAMLKDDGPPPLPAYAAFGAAATLPGRHICVLLPFQALQKALELAEPG